MNGQFKKKKAALKPFGQTPEDTVHAHLTNRVIYGMFGFIFTLKSEAPLRKWFLHKLGWKSAVGRNVSPDDIFVSDKRVLQNFDISVEL